MQKFAFPDNYRARRPSFWGNTLVLISIMALYPLAGVLLLFFLPEGIQASKVLLNPGEIKDMLPVIRIAQSAGQILVLALPVVFLARWHTGKKGMFSLESLEFLGIRKHIDVGSIALAVSGIFLLQPLLFTVTALQDVFLWPSLGGAGAEVIRQRDMMEAVIKELALMRTVPEFVSVLFVLAITPAVCEELFFRGYIQQNYSRSMSRSGAVLLTGAIFAFFHQSAANLLPLALLGWYIGYIYSETGNIAICFFVHFFNNLAALILLFAEGSRDLVIPVIVSRAADSVLHKPWWWVGVAVSLFLFFMVIKRFSAVLPSNNESL